MDDRYLRHVTRPRLRVEVSGRAASLTKWVVVSLIQWRRRRGALLVVDVAQDGTLLGPRLAFRFFLTLVLGST